MTLARYAEGPCISIGDVAVRLGRVSPRSSVRLFDTCMQNGQLHASSCLAEAEWVSAPLRPFGSGVASIVPDGFPAYVRILRSAYGPGSEMLSWAEVAAASGRIMHRLAQFHAISGPKAAASIGTVYLSQAGNLDP